MMNKSTIAIAVAAASMSTIVHSAPRLEEVVVTAQKREQNLQDVPVSIAVVSAEDMSRTNVNDMASLALTTPALNFQGAFTPSATNFNIRGVGSYSSEGGIQPSVSMVVDGVPYARAGEFVSELADIERVEILRGPQGTLFGRNSTGGVINITTRNPTDELEGSVEASFTDDDDMLYRGWVSGPISDNARGLISGFYRDRDGHIENIYPGNDELGGMETWGLRGKLAVDFSDKLGIIFTADYRDADHGMSPAVAEVPEPQLDDIPAAGLNLRVIAQGNGDPALGQAVMDDIFKVNTNIDGSVGELENAGLSMDVTYDISDDLTLRSITSWREWREGFNQDVDGGPGQLSNGGFGLPILLDGTNLAQNPNDDNFRQFENNYVSQELRLEGVSDSVSWTAGLFYTKFEETIEMDLELYAPFPEVGTVLVSTILDNTVDQDAYAIFGDATIQVTDTLAVFGGLRWSFEDMEIDYNSNIYQIPDFLGITTLHPETNSATVDTTSPLLPLVTTPIIGKASEDIDEWSGRLGLRWDLSDDSNIYTSVSRGFVGTGADITQTGSPDNAFLDPTITEAFEIGIKSRLLDDRLELNAAFFIQDVEDLQSAVILPGTVQSVNLNAGDLEIQGVEVDAVWAMTEMVTLSVGVAYTDATVEDLILACYPEQDESSGCIDGQTDVSGSDAPNTPELKYNISLNADIPFDSLPFDGFAFVGYTWQDEVHYSLNDDPLLYQDDYGLLDITLGLIDREGHYEVSLFGKNVTDEEFVNFAADSSGFIARRWINTPRGAQSYYGIKLKYNFF